MGLAAGCNNQPAASTDHAAQTPASENPAVKIVHPEKKDVRRLIERPGYNIEAYERTLLYAKIPGYVLKWNVDMGDSVHKDDILAELFIPEMEVELKQKNAAVQQASAEIRQAEAAVLRAQAELKQAESQYHRLARVERTGVLDKEQLDETRYRFEAAQAALAKAHADVDAAKARLGVAEADRDHTQTLLQYTKVRAPFDGIVTGRRTINIGDFVQPASANKGESLFIVERIKPVRVFVNVPELDAAWVRDGDTARVRAQGLQGQEFKGTVTRVSRSLHPQNRTLRTEIDLPNADGRLLPGMFVNATIVVEHQNVWSLPETAVLGQREESYAYFIENGRAVRTPVQIGISGGGLIEITRKKNMKTHSQGSWEDLSGKEDVISDASLVSNEQKVTTAIR
jgi:RND family efflux transporter MFP subunit